MSSSPAPKDPSTSIAILDVALDDIRESLKEAPSSTARVHRAKLETYERVFHSWQQRPPSEEQFRTLTECIMDLREEVLGHGSEGGWSTTHRESDAPAAVTSLRPTRPVPNAEVPSEARPSANPEKAR